MLNKILELLKESLPKKRTYKGHSVSVEYYVEGILYERKDGFDKKFEKGFDQGGSITIKYSKSKPELINSILTIKKLAYNIYHNRLRELTNGKLV